MFFGLFFLFMYLFLENNLIFFILENYFKGFLKFYVLRMLYNKL